MGADIKALRVRIKSVDSTLHLTKAMGLVASSKMRRAFDAMQKSREYSAALNDIVDLLTLSPECMKSPYMRNSPKNRRRIIVIAGDRGLAGGYNANVFKIAEKTENAEFIPIGKRACGRFGGDEYYAEKFSCDDAEKLARKLCRDFEKNDFDSLEIICTRYISVMSQQAYIRRVLPLERASVGKRANIIFEPDEAAVFERVIPEYVAASIIAAVRESYASEVAARRCAMDAADKNANKMLDELKLSYNRARQSAITREITEIVAGSGI